MAQQAGYQQVDLPLPVSRTLADQPTQLAVRSMKDG